MTLIDRLLGRERTDPQAIERRRQELQDLRALLATPEGRRVLWRVLEFADLYHCEAEADQRADHARRGRRKVGVWLLQEIAAADPERWLLMQREAMERART